jgi:Flp pilus assembly protein TadD
MVLLREACCLEPEDPRLWTLYATACIRQRRIDDAARALSQAVWLRERQGDDVRAAVTRRLLERTRAASGAWLRCAA